MNEVIQVSFDYGTLGAGAKVLITTATQEIRDRVGRAAQNIMEIGTRLILVKQHLDHGQFGEWLESEFGWTDRTARNMMNVAEAFKSETVSDLQSIAPSALYMLASPSMPKDVREKFVEQARAGERVTKADVKKATNKAKPEKSRDQEIAKAAKVRAEQDRIAFERDAKNERKKAAYFGGTSDDTPATTGSDEGQAGDGTDWELDESEEQEKADGQEETNNNLSGVGANLSTSVVKDVDTRRGRRATNAGGSRGIQGQTQAQGENSATDDHGGSVATNLAEPWAKFVAESDALLNDIESTIRKLAKLWQVENSLCNHEYVSEIRYELFKQGRYWVKNLRERLPGAACETDNKGWVTRAVAKGREVVKKAQRK